VSMGWSVDFRSETRVDTSLRCGSTDGLCVVHWLVNPGWSVFARCLLSFVSP
jgi:hypothetical protein